MKKSPRFLRNIDILEAKNNLRIIRDSSIFGFSLLLYFIVMYIVGDLVKYMGGNAKEVLIVTYVACNVTAIILYCYVKRCKIYRDRNLRFVIRNVNIGKLLSIYSLDLMLKLYCIVLFGIIQQVILNKIGISIIADSPNDPLESSIIYIIISSILAPISEELICRGIGVGILKEYGRTTAILFVSMMFGLCHGNIVQSICAMIGGIALSYVYLEYGLKYSIFLHMLNNFLVNIIRNNGITFLILIVVTVTVGMITLYRKKDYIIKYLRNNSFRVESLILEIVSPFIIILIIGSICVIGENIKTI